MISYVTFTKRTNHPKLRWLINLCQLARLNVQLAKYMPAHAPVSLVKECDEAEAWELLTVVDDIPDDARLFTYLPVSATLEMLRSEGFDTFTKERRLALLESTIEELRVDSRESDLV